MMIYLKALLLAIMVLTPGVAAADQSDERLDSLFARLQLSKDPTVNSIIEGHIWGIWLQSDSDTVNLLMQQGITAMSAGDQASALAAFDTITELEPAFSEGWNKRATVLYLMGRYQESAADCARVLDLEPRHFGALSGLGLIFTALEQPEQALQAFERVLEIYPANRNAKLRVKSLRKKLKGEKI